MLPGFDGTRTVTYRLILGGPNLTVSLNLREKRLQYNYTIPALLNFSFLRCRTEGVIK